MGILKRKCSYGCLLNRYLKTKAVNKLKAEKLTNKDNIYAKLESKSMGAKYGANI